MRTVERLRMHCVQCVLEFLRRYPDPTPAAQELVARLEQLFVEVAALLEARLLAHQSVAAAQAERRRVLAPVRRRLAHLVRLARAVAIRERMPELRLNVSFRATGLAAFVVSARAAVATAATHQALLLRNGMPAVMLEDLARDLERCAATRERQASALAACNQARADITARAAEAADIVRHLDALNQIRFADEPERLAEWAAASRGTQAVGR